MFDDGDRYQQFMGRFSDRVAIEFLDDLGVAPGRRWLDVGCGAGALLSAILARSRPSECIGVDPSAAQVAQAEARLGPAVRLLVAGAESMPLDDDSVDVTVSALSLNFCPDPLAALSEMARVTEPAGLVAGYVWDYGHGAFFLHCYWQAAAALGMTSGDERARWGMCSPEGMAELLDEHHDETSTVWTIEVPTPFGSFDELWSGFELGVGPSGAHLATLSASAASALRRTVLDMVADRGGIGAMSARAVAFRLGVATTA